MIYVFIKIIFIYINDDYPACEQIHAISGCILRFYFTVKQLTFNAGRTHSEKNLVWRITVYLRMGLIKNHEVAEIQHGYVSKPQYAVVLFKQG